MAVQLLRLEYQIELYKQIVWFQQLSYISRSGSSNNEWEILDPTQCPLGKYHPWQIKVKSKDNQSLKMQENA